MSLTILPNSGQTLNQTRDPIRNNFQSIQNAFVVNHVDFGLPDQGKHNFITFPVQSSSPAIAYPDIGVFSKLYAPTGINELFFINSGNVPAEVPFTAANFSTTQGWTFLPSGLLIKWGQDNGNGNKTINANAFGPAYTNLYTAIITTAGASFPASDTNQFVRLDSITNPATITVWCSARTTLGAATAGFFWVSIGSGT